MKLGIFMNPLPCRFFIFILTKLKLVSREKILRQMPVAQRAHLWVNENRFLGRERGDEH